ncbi:unnamed protein product, partial [Pleuronectes platessa]
ARVRVAVLIEDSPTHPALGGFATELHVRYSLEQGKEERVLRAQFCVGCPSPLGPHLLRHATRNVQVNNMSVKTRERREEGGRRDERRGGRRRDHTTGQRLQRRRQ